MPKVKKRPLCAPVEQCIYCGAKDVLLTDEHVIPAGLDGERVIPKASCQACQEITSQFERQVLRGPLREPRFAMGIPAHKRKQRPETLPLTIDGTVYDVPADEHPASLVFVDFIPPSFETGAYPRSKIQLRSHRHTLYAERVRDFYYKNVYPNLSQSEKRKFEEKGYKITVETSVTFGPEELVAFVRLLAKIAHCLSVAILGKDRITENLVVPLILGKNKFYNHLVVQYPLSSLFRHCTPLYGNLKSPISLASKSSTGSPILERDVIGLPTFSSSGIAMEEELLFRKSFLVLFSK